MQDESTALPTRTVTLGGRRYDLFGPSAGDPYFVELADDFEPHFLDLCGRILQPGSICLDIGANLGAKSLIMAQFVQAGRIVAVEAAPRVARALRANVARHGDGLITALACAVGETDGEATFHDNSAYGHVAASGNADTLLSLRDAGAAIASSGVRVPMRRLSTILRETGLERVDFIKMDIEGSEEPVLRDARDLIVANRTVALFEFNVWAQMAYANRSPRAFAEWLVGAFSHVFMVRPQGPRAVLERVEPGAWSRILYANTCTDGSVTDIVATNAPERIAPVAERTQQLQAECDALHGQLAALQARLDAAQREVEALRGSTSWRITAPLRALRGG